MTSVASPMSACSNPQCHVLETNKCLEGIAPIDACPRFGRKAEPTGGEDDVAPDPETVRLAPGVRLTPHEAPLLLRVRPSRVVAILGGRDAGKTSLIAAVYGLFQDGGLGEYLFRSSDTLVSFEETCHDARAVSEREESHHERTPRGAVGLYHLGLHHPSTGKDLDLFLADRSGEEYLEAADCVSEASAFSEVQRADVVTLLVDGARLTDTQARHNLQSELLMTMRSLRDAAHFRSNQRLAIVLTKHDLIVSSQNAQRAQDDFTRMIDKLSRLLGDDFVAIEEFETAASPASSILPRGSGLSALVSYWMSPLTHLSEPSSVEVEPERAFERLTAR